MKIALVSVLSEVHDQAKIDETLKDKLAYLNDNFEIDEIEIDQLAETDFTEYDLSLSFIKSGGSENIFAEILEYLPQPIYLLTTELHNSLPAALEILSYLNRRDIKAKIIHGSPEEMTAEIKKLAAYKKVKTELAAARLGVIGKPSDWLIGSGVDYDLAGAHWGTEFIDLELAELYQILEGIDSKEAEKIAANFAAEAAEIVEADQAELTKAARIYLALKELIADYELDALTLRCFDIVKKLNTTGCLALALLNNEGLIAGCEGDLPALFTMFLAYKLTGKIPFMANPAAIDKQKEEILFAHCTVATGISEEYIIRSHFETGIGVGIQGLMKKGPVTVFKIGGSGLEEYFVAEGEITANLDSPNACRTQLKISLPQSSDYFFNDSIGNHHLIIPGYHAEKIDEFLAAE